MGVMRGVSRSSVSSRLRRHLLFQGPDRSKRTIKSDAFYAVLVDFCVPQDIPASSCDRVPDCHREELQIRSDQSQGV